MEKINNWVLGLTGGIGSGKTAISDMLSKLGVTIVDADIIARDVVAKDSKGLKAITQHFGEKILLDDGNLDRAKLREIIFQQAAEKAWLNNLLHPLIRAQLILELNQATPTYVVLVAPLLFENGLEKYCQRTLLIDVPVDTQLARTTKRDYVSIEQVKNIIASQLPRETKQAKADDILNNDRRLDEVRLDLIKLHQTYLAEAQHIST